MKTYKNIKKVVFSILLCTTTLVSGQKLTFKIENDSIAKKLFLTGINDEVVKSIYEKENTFDVDYLDLDEGYYLLKKEDKSVVLYLKPTDELTIAFDNDDFYKSLNFSGEGSYVNTYLLNKRAKFLDRKGRLRKYYKKFYYEGDENEYLDYIDKLYKANYGTLFAGKLSKKFRDEEMKNLQYGYSLDLLKYQDAKKYYKLKDSLPPSRNFLEPLNNTHFQNNQLYKKYNSYKELVVLKWKKDIEKLEGYALKEDLFSSIRIEPLKEAVLHSLYEDMNRAFPERTKDYFQLIKRNTDDSKLLAKAKQKYASIRYVEAEKNLSRFEFFNSNKEIESLAQFKGKFIFLNIWTTFCKPCLDNFREIERLEDVFYEDNMVFVSLALDKEEEFGLWKNMLEENGLKRNQLFLKDAKSKFLKTYEVNEIPSFVLLSPKGVLLDTVIDKLSSKKTEKAIKEQVRK